MPRPKRAKVAPSAPAPRLRKPQRTTPGVAANAPASTVQSEKTYDISDPEEGTTRSVRRVKKNNGKGKAPRGRDSSAEDDNIQEPGMKARKELDLKEHGEPSMSGALFDDIDLESSNGSIEISRRETNTPSVETSRLSLANFRRRARQPSILGRGPVRARSSSVESNLAQDNGLMSVGRRNMSAMGASHFRGRQRQASVTRNNVAPSSMALDMDRGTPAHTGSVLNLGNFRRRARAPSILGTAQKRQEERPDFDLDDEDDFEPDDESTPLNFNRSRRVGTSTPMMGSSNSRKRKLSDVQVPQSSGSLPSPTISQPEEAIPATLSDEVEEEAEEDQSDQGSAAEELPMPSIEHEQSATPEPLSETMAPPQSSSSQPSSPISPTLPPSRQQVFRGRPISRGRSLRNRTPPLRTQDSPISSPPSLTHSPNRAGLNTTAKQRNRKPAPPPSTFSTAQLQSLMPRRRRRRPNADPFDVPSSDGEVDVSGLASDDDELSHLQVRVRPPRRPTSTNVSRPKTISKSKTTAPASKRTYSRPATNSDKENEEELDPDDSLAPLPDDDGSTENSQELEQRVGRELKSAARKFEEVDKWELDFEDVTASSDNPRDWDAR